MCIVTVVLHKRLTAESGALVDGAAAFVPASNSDVRPLGYKPRGGCGDC